MRSWRDSLAEAAVTGGGSLRILSKRSVRPGTTLCGPARALEGRRVADGKVRLLVARPELAKEVERLVHDVPLPRDKGIMVAQVKGSVEF
jgi:hypothetical protein